ncbi:MAG: hypothetical protein ABIG70_13550 [Pseudomonadota bacterium]|nr:hypothetical protein [Gammaproteobacteria bacterium]MBU1732064.1 hypothetical protein [Gammaproteobacteria bacterium]MBU1894105.1 hypothetical protein [Gammaproteobacteria bacterium]
MATSYPGYELAYALAVDLCSHWKHENHKSVLSVDDLMKIKEWVNTSGSGVIKYPAMAPLATRGLDDLIAENFRTDPPGANLLRI